MDDDPMPKKFVCDIERILDDFIFMCFFVGNDFLPHMPTLDINENALDLLMYVYKNDFKSLGGYLVDMQRVNDGHAGYIKLKRVEKFILSVGRYEEKIFKKRTDIRDRKLRRISERLKSEAESLEQHQGLEVNETDINEDQGGNDLQTKSSSEVQQEMLANTKELKEKLRNNIRQKSDIFKDGNLGRDKVNLGSVGWKQRYYKEKFSAEDPKEVEMKRQEIVQNYTEGLCWVLLYYFSGIPSWNWYYPFHYGTFASDLRGLSGVKVKFQKGSPFKPFDQLMAVLPPKSAHALPIVYQELMTDSNNSSIIEFYPNDFEVDVDGKRFLWQGICKLPFIDQEKLLNATRQVEQKVEESEAKRNVETTDILFISASNSSETEYGGYLQQHTETEGSIKCFRLELPVASLNIPRLLEGTKPPEKIIFENDIKEIVPWHEYRRPSIPSRYNTAPMNSKTMNKPYNVNAGNIRNAGQGRGFGPAGRGQGRALDCRLSHNNNVPYQSNTVTQKNFWPSRNCVLQHENTSWRPLSSHVRPGFSSQSYEGSTVQFRPHHAHSPQVTGRGRGRGRSGPHMHNDYSVERPDKNTPWRQLSHIRPAGYLNRGFEGSSAHQFRPCHGHSPQFTGRGRGGRSGPQMHTHDSGSRTDHRDHNYW